MKCQSLFSVKIRKFVINFLSAELAKRMVKVKYKQYGGQKLGNYQILFNKL